MPKLLNCRILSFLLISIRRIEIRISHLMLHVGCQYRALTASITVAAIGRTI